MIRYFCNNCGQFFRGGVEDKQCPLCNSNNIKLVEIW